MARWSSIYHGIGKVSIVSIPYYSVYELLMVYLDTELDVHVSDFRFDRVVLIG